MSHHSDVLKEKYYSQLAMALTELRDDPMTRFSVCHGYMEDVMVKNRPLKIIRYELAHVDVKYYVEYYPEVEFDDFHSMYTTSVQINRCWTNEKFTLMLHPVDINQYFTALEDRFGVMIR